MATTNYARFTINGTASEDTNGNRGYDASAGETLAVTLEINPSLGALTITYELYDSTNAASPRNSLYDSALVFTETGAKAWTSSLVNSTVHIAIPAGAGISSYTLRATAVTATGAQVFERIIAVRKNGLRMTVPAESNQYGQRGWSDALNELTKYIADGGFSITTVTSTQTGIVAAFPASARRIFHSDGSTAGGVWTALSQTDLDSALSASSVSAAKLVPSGTDGYVLKTISGVATWAADTTLHRPESPGENYYVAVGLNGDLSYMLIGNDQIASGAAIDVSKLAPGTNSYYLRTVNGAVVWATYDGLNAPANPGDDGKVAMASGGNLVYGYVSNSQISASANIAITKLAAGSEGQVIKVVSGVITWASDGGGEVNLPTAGTDDGKVAFANNGNIDYADGVFMLNVSGGQNAISLSASLFNNATAVPVTPVGTEFVLWNNNGSVKWTNSSATFNVLLSDQPANPTDNDKVAVASGGFLSYQLLTNGNISDSAAIAVVKLESGAAGTVLKSDDEGVPIWGLLVNSNISSSAAINVSKLAPGTNDYYLRTISGAVVWSATIDGGDIASATVPTTALSQGSEGTVLLTNFSSVVAWSQITNAFISSSAAISVTKLATGSSNSVLASDGASNFWDTTPTVTSLYATSYVQTGEIIMNQAGFSSTVPTSGAIMNTYANITYLKYSDGTIFEIGSYSYG